MYGRLLTDCRAKQLKVQRFARRRPARDDSPGQAAWRLPWPADDPISKFMRAREILPELKLGARR